MRGGLALRPPQIARQSSRQLRKEVPKKEGAPKKEGKTKREAKREGGVAAALRAEGKSGESPAGAAVEGAACAEAGRQRKRSQVEGAKADTCAKTARRRLGEAETLLCGDSLLPRRDPPAVGSTIRRDDDGSGDGGISAHSGALGAQSSTHGSLSGFTLSGRVDAGLKAKASGWPRAPAVAVPTSQPQRAPNKTLAQETPAPGSGLAHSPRADRATTRAVVIVQESPVQPRQPAIVRSEQW